LAQIFGELIRERRLKVGISQEELAHQCDIERSYVGRIERGTSQPGLHLIFKLSDALRMDVGRLVREVHIAVQGLPAPRSLARDKRVVEREVSRMKPTSASSKPRR
jgi:transcriptional regulator with XRE-family HTH domain